MDSLQSIEEVGFVTDSSRLDDTGDPRLVFDEVVESVPLDGKEFPKYIPVPVILQEPPVYKRLRIESCF